MPTIHRSIFRFGLAGRDKALPAHHIRVGRPFGLLLALVVMAAIAVAAVALAVALVRAERERVVRFFADQDAAGQRITVVYDRDGIVCSVPRGQERAAAVVNQGCTALAGALKLAGVTK